MQIIDQDRLISLARDGSEYAISRLYEDHSQGVFRFLYYRTGDRSLAEDLTSEVFIRMLKSLPKFSERSGSFRSWLYTIARNITIDHYRKMKPGVDLPFDDELISSDPDPEDLLNAAESRQHLTASILELSEEHREIIALRFISHLSIQETASTLGKTVDSVKGLQYRALGILRDKMRDRKEVEHE